jgi:hypothetical protein
MPAVDYGLPGGLSAAELSVILRTLVDSGGRRSRDHRLQPRPRPGRVDRRWFVRSIADGLAMDRRV